LVAVLAHQGGWDEILMVTVPIALFAVLLWIANRRAAAALAAEEEDEEEEEGVEEPG
jgi:hypothetical protein